MKKPILIIILAFVANFIISCDINEPSCTGGNDWPQHKTKINSMELKLGVFQEASFSTDFAVNSYKRVALQFAVTKIDTVETIQPEASAFNFSIFNSAFAVPGPPRPIPLQKITSIKIISDKEVVTESKSFAAASDITELFNLKRNYSHYDSINKFISQQNNPFGFEEDNLLFQLKAAPTKKIDAHTITITLTLDDGKVFEQKVENFTVEI